MFGAAHIELLCCHVVVVALELRWRTVCIALDAVGKDEEDE